MIPASMMPGAKEDFRVAVDAKTRAVWTTYTDGVNSYAQSWVVP